MRCLRYLYNFDGRYGENKITFFFFAFVPNLLHVNILLISLKKKNTKKNYYLCLCL